MATHRQLFKSGNSLVACLPTYYLDSLGLTRGDTVKIDLVEGKYIQISRKLTVDEQLAERRRKLRSRR